MAPETAVARVLHSLEAYVLQQDRMALGSTELERIANFSRRWAYREMLEVIRALKREYGI